MVTSDGPDIRPDNIEIFTVMIERCVKGRKLEKKDLFLDELTMLSLLPTCNLFMQQLLIEY